ncbi:MAG: NRDE family protein [Cyclobacteriaceae bacterium]
MCLIAFAWDVHPKYKLIVSANRDEFYDRPTAQAGLWEDHPHILGGRDLEAKGTWMAVSANGKFAAVTNYRDLSNIRKDARSRGEIPTDYLNGQYSPMEFLQHLHNHSEDYNGFNIIVGNQQELLHYSNYERKINPIKPGVYGLSNALLDTPWPKVSLLKQKFRDSISEDFTDEDLIQLMQDDQVAEDQILPDTGVSPELEKALSAICIRMEGYGTCCSTVITLDRMGKYALTEKTYPFGGRPDQIVRFSVDIK